MSDQTEPSAMQNARYEASVRALEFELDQFWKRSLFFWGFISAALVAFCAAAAYQHPLLQGVIASFGFVCSAIWTLANRGGKFWYENWESKRIAAEKSITGKLYGEPEPEKRKDKWQQRWLQGKRYSPSKLAIALSDYVVFLWFCLLVSRLIKILPLFKLSCPLVNWLVGLTCIFMVISFLYVFLVWSSCPHKNDPDESTTQK